MKQKKKPSMVIQYLPFFLFIFFLIGLNNTDLVIKDNLTNNFFLFTREMLLFLPFIFILIGLLDIWFPREMVEKHIGHGSSLKGTILIILLAMFQAGPLYGAFPVTYLLWKKGCSVRNIFVYLGAFSALKIPMLSFEIGFLGLKFSVLRILFALPLFIGIAYLMDFLLKNKNFEVKEP